MMNTPALPPMESPVCPLPLGHHDTIVMGHGSGGLMTKNLIEKVFMPAFSNPALNAGNDFAILNHQTTSNNKRLVVSTDCHIVSPLFFPGGDIGRLAVCGTVNDVSMSGAVPHALTAGFILEEGTPVSVLQRIVASMKDAADEACISIVAGDTKVVGHGQGDQVYITATGFGWADSTVNIHGANAHPGDAVLISGTIGDHGIAVLAARNDLRFSTPILSDAAPLNHLIQQLLKEIPDIHVLRDPTRGGLSTTLCEIAQQSAVTIWINEETLPIKHEVKSVCEILGFDPLYIANEGKVIIILPDSEKEKALQILHTHPYGKDAAMIGNVQKQEPGRVLLKTPFGSTRILDMLAGEMLPRIC